jgi:hypothetical protein
MWQFVVVALIKLVGAVAVEVTIVTIQTPMS